MDTGYLISLLQELAYFLIVFGGFLFYSLIKGRQAVINVVTGLYFALLIYLVFPYYDVFLASAPSAHSEAIGRLVIFLVFTLLATILIARLMPEEYREKKFESFHKKIALSLAGTVLVMIFSFHALPLTEILTPGTPIQYLFGNPDYYFWWLLAPMVVLYWN